MIRKPFSIEERQELLAARDASLREYNAAMDRIAECLPGSAQENGAVVAAEPHLQAAAQAEREYFQRLPRVVMSCCPFDGKPLVRTFDPYGFDGPWWRSDAAPEEVPSCPHFCVLRGAVALHPQSPDRADLQVLAGPERPYVIPRILEKPALIAVISQLEMTPAHTAYLIAYFAERRPPVQESAASWPRTVFPYTTALGHHRWRFDSDRWDFDLTPWLAEGKLHWCEPGSDNEHLSDHPKERCPYVNLPAPRRACDAVARAIPGRAC